MALVPHGRHGPMVPYRRPFDWYTLARMAWNRRHHVYRAAHYAHGVYKSWRSKKPLRIAANRTSTRGYGGSSFRKWRGKPHYSLGHTGTLGGMARKGYAYFNYKNVGIHGVIKNHRAGWHFEPGFHSKHWGVNTFVPYNRPTWGRKKYRRRR